MKLTWTALKLETQWTSAIGLKLNRCIIYIYIYNSNEEQVPKPPQREIRVRWRGEKGNEGSKANKTRQQERVKRSLHNHLKRIFTTPMYALIVYGDSGSQSPPHIRIWVARAISIVVVPLGLNLFINNIEFLVPEKTIKHMNRSYFAVPFILVLWFMENLSDSWMTLRP